MVAARNNPQESRLDGSSFLSERERFKAFNVHWGLIVMLM
jgi:hypothetical protein